MPNSIRALGEYDLLFCSYLQTILKMPSGSILISYSQDGQPGFSINENMVFVHTEVYDSFQNFYKDRFESYSQEQGQFVVNQKALRELELQLVFYGPNSDVNCQTVLEYLTMSNSTDFFISNNISFISSKSSITKTHEKINNRWWKRTDLNIHFYDTVKVEGMVDPVESVEVTIDSVHVKTIIE